MRYNMKLAIAVSLLSAAQSVQAGPLRWGGYLVERQAAETPERLPPSGEAEITGVPRANTTTYAPTARIPDTTTILSTASAADHDNGRRYEINFTDETQDEMSGADVHRPGDGSNDGSEEGDTAGKPALETLSDLPEIDDSLKSFIDDDAPSTSEYIPDPDLTTIDIIGPSTTEEKSSATTSLEKTSSKTITSDITPSETPIEETTNSETASETTSTQRQATGFPENTPSGIDEDITKPITQTQFLPPTPSDEATTTVASSTSSTDSSDTPGETTTRSSKSVIEPPAASDERGTPATTLTPSPERTTRSSDSSSSSATTELPSTVTPPTTPEVPDEGRVGSPSGSPDSTTATEGPTTELPVIEPSSSSGTTSADEAAPIETPIETPPGREAPGVSTSSSTTVVESDIENPSEPAPTSVSSSTRVEVPEIPIDDTTSSTSSGAPESTTVEITITSGKELPTADEPKQPSFTPVPQPSDEPEEPAEPEQPTPPETTNKPEQPAQPTTYEEPAPPSTSSEEAEPTTTLQATSTSSTTLTVSVPPGANPDVPTALPPPTMTTSLSPEQSSANLQSARQINDLYGTLSPNTPCFDGQYACVNGKVAECRGETFDISSCKVEGERCFALPAKEMEGVVVGCWDEGYAMAVLSGFGERYSKTASPPKETKGEQDGDHDEEPGETLTQSIDKPASTARAQPTEQPAPPPAEPPKEKAPPAPTGGPAPPPADDRPAYTWLSSGESLFLTINPNPDGTTTIIAEQAAPTEDSALRTTQIVDGVPTVSVVSTVTITQAAVTVTEAAVTVTEPAVTVTVTATVGGAGDRVEQVTVSDFAEGDDGGEVVNLGMAP